MKSLDLVVTTVRKGKLATGKGGLVNIKSVKEGCLMLNSHSFPNYIISVVF
jgi:hypothetical protein